MVSNGDNGIPSPTESNGRGPDGRFLKGNSFATGNPLQARVGRLRAALLRAVKPADVTAIIEKLVKLAKAGDTAAAKIILDRCFGKPAQAIELTPSRDLPVKVVSGIDIDAVCGRRPADGE